jgi:hypothetical protein
MKILVWIVLKNAENPLCSVATFLGTVEERDYG